MREVIGPTLVGISIGLGAASIAVGVNETTKDPVEGPTSGHCRTYVNEADPSQYAIACVPSTGWSGGGLVSSWEDGSAIYSDGSTFDPEDMRYQ